MAASEIIDVHAHVYPDGCFAEVLKDRPAFTMVDNPRGQSLLYRGSHVMSMPAEQDNLPKRLASMDDAGIGMAVLSVGALNIGWAGARDGAAARAVNDGLAAACRQHPTRFRFVAVLPTTSRVEMVQELDRALGLGAAGVGIATNIGDWQLHAPEVRDFWREMNRRKLMVLIHPTTPCDAPQNDPGTFLSVGYPGETAMAATEARPHGRARRMPRSENRLVALGRRPADDLGPHRPRLSTLLQLPASAELLSAPLLLRYRMHAWPGAPMRARDLGRWHLNFRQRCAPRAEHGKRNSRGAQ